MRKPRQYGRTATKRRRRKYYGKQKRSERARENERHQRAMNAILIGERVLYGENSLQLQ